MQIWDGTREIAYLWNSRSKRVALKVPSWSITDEEGRIVPMCQLVRPTGGTRMQEIAMWASLWKEIDRDEFQKLWERSEEHTSELQSLMRISYAVFCLKKKTKNTLYTKQY